MPKRTTTTPVWPSLSPLMPVPAPKRGGLHSRPDYIAHPFLDPELFLRDRHALRYFMRLFRDYMRNDWQYARLLNRLLHPVGHEDPVEVNERVLASYFEDANTYVRELLDLIPEEIATPHLPDPEVEECNNLPRLGQMIFEHGDDPVHSRRRRFEAQRKLYLTKLLIQIEHTRMVQDGPRHRRHLLELLDKELWAYTTDVHDQIARYSPGASDDLARDVGDAESWNFRVRRVQRALPGSVFDIEICHFDTRFKKESAGYDYAPGRSQYQVAERSRYTHMKRNRSASILSKMLRKGINNPNGITDMLGAKFIVNEERDVRRLADLLHHVLGGLFLFRNQVDLFDRPQDRSLLNPFSAPDFRAFKEDVDILYAPRESEDARPYLFSVEVQIFTVESFLQTVHSRAYTSHTEYKRRQFLQGVMPYVFPATVYGAPDAEPDEEPDEHPEAERDTGT